MGMIQSRQKLVPEYIKLAVRANIPLMIHGPPGVGKSYMSQATAAELGMQFIDVRVSTMDPVDIRGVPSVNREEKLTSWNPPDFLPRDPEAKAIIAFEEITHGDDAQQSACFQIIHDRRCGDYVLPPGCVPIAMTNRAEDLSIVNDMASALKNRFFHIEVMSNYEDWTDWAVTEGIHESIISFIRFKPQMLNEFVSVGDADRRQALAEEMAFATERSWHFLSTLMNAGIPTEIEEGTIAGTIGEAAMTEYLAFVHYYKDLPDLDAVIKDPQILFNRYPNLKEMEPATLYAICTGLSARITMDPKVVSNFFEILKKLSTEFATMAVRDALRLDRDIMETKEFTDWAMKNATFLSGS